MENSLYDQIYQIGLIPVIAIENADHAVPLAEALIRGGIPAAEVTFRTAAGEEAIRRIAQNCPGILLGAGTVLNIDQCDRAVAAGARFIVSPGYNDELVAHCQDIGVPVFPGCTSPSELTKAVNAGLQVVKFFPAEQSGGLAAIQSLAPVFPNLKFMPTGGINAKNLNDYLSCRHIVACGGTWMVKSAMIAAEHWDTITQLCREAVQTMLGFSLRHIGINCADAAEAKKTAESFCALLGLEYREGNASIFAGTAVEVMKYPYLGRNGHIAIGTPNVDRAIYHLQHRGIEFNEETRGMAPDGRTQVIYLKEEFGGFAIHLVRV